MFWNVEDDAETVGVSGKKTGLEVGKWQRGGWGYRRTNWTGGVDVSVCGNVGQMCGCCSSVALGASKSRVNGVRPRPSAVRLTQKHSQPTPVRILAQPEAYDGREHQGWVDGSLKPRTLPFRRLVYCGLGRSYTLHITDDKVVAKELMYVKMRGC